MLEWLDCYDIDNKMLDYVFIGVLVLNNEKLFMVIGHTIASEIEIFLNDNNHRPSFSLIIYYSIFKVDHIY